MFSDVLLTVDFDRTLTAPDSTIPQRNLDAITYFMENGGTFTVNTGRGGANFLNYMETIPASAPFLLLNGCASYHNGEYTLLHTIDMDIWKIMEELVKLYPDMNPEIQGTDIHYLINPSPKAISLYENLGWRYEIATWGQDVGPLMKFALWGDAHKPVISNLFTDATEKELADFDKAEETLRALCADKAEVIRSAKRIIDIQPKDASKLLVARQLQKNLGKKILVCVGDAENDIPMLEGADYAFVPADGSVANQFSNVCPCAQGAIADVIYKQIPKILGIVP